MPSATTGTRMSASRRSSQCLSPPANAMSEFPNILNKLVGLTVADVSDDNATMIELKMVRSGFCDWILRRKYFVWLHSCHWEIYQHGKLELSSSIDLPLESTPWSEISSRIDEVCRRARKLLIGRSLQKLSFQNKINSTLKFDSDIEVRTKPNPNARGFNDEPGPQISLMFPGSKNVNFEQDGTFNQY